MRAKENVWVSKFGWVWLSVSMRRGAELQCRYQRVCSDCHQLSAVSCGLFFFSSSFYHIYLKCIQLNTICYVGGIDCCSVLTADILAVIGVQLRYNPAEGNWDGMIIEAGCTSACRKDSKVTPQDILTSIFFFLGQLIQHQQWAWVWLQRD